MLRDIFVDAFYEIGLEIAEGVLELPRRPDDRRLQRRLPCQHRRVQPARIGRPGDPAGEGREGRPCARPLIHLRAGGYRVTSNSTGANLTSGLAPVLARATTLQLADTRTGAAVVLASDIGRSIQRIPGVPGAISFVQRERSAGTVSLIIKELNASTRQISVLTPAVAGSTEADCAWTPDGTLLMVKGATLYGWKRGQSGWKEIISLDRLSLSGVTRLAVSPKGDYLALVGPPRQPR